MSYWYLATPYSKYKGGDLELAWAEACKQTALLMRAGVPVFSPIAHTHPVATFGKINPLDHDIWLPIDTPMMQAAKGLIVCEMEGWRTSYGVGKEIEHFQASGKPVIHMTPGEVPEQLVRRQKVIGLVGYARSGKDTAAKGLLADGWQRVALADGVREALLALNPCVHDDVHNWGFLRTPGDYVPLSLIIDKLPSGEASIGWEEAKKLPMVRALLQRMGTEAGRSIHGSDCWINLARRKIEATTANVVVTDCRFANEAAFIRSLGGKLLWIERPGVGPVNAHVSDAGLSALKDQCDAHVLNIGTEAELQAAVRELA